MIEINVSNKVATLVEETFAVCDNSDYVIHFNFDAEWNGIQTKTARFKYFGLYKDVIFDGDTVEMPIIEDSYAVEVGVYAGNLKTTTPAYLPLKKSVLSGDEVHAEPPVDIYNQLMERFNNSVLTTPQNLTPEQKAQARENIGATNGSSGSIGGTLNHNELLNRNVPNQHDINAIAGLSDALDGLDVEQGRLQGQIDALSASSDVVDIVADLPELQDYDITYLFDNDIIKVLSDEEHEDAPSYYRWSNGDWVYVGSESPSYTKAETNALLGAKYTKPTGGIPESDLSSAVREKLNNESGTTDNIHYHSGLKNAVDDANADFENEETATKTTAICRLTKLLSGDYVIDCLTDAAITEVLKPSVTMRINTNGHAVTVNNNGGQIISTTGNTDKIFDFVFDATGSAVTITGGSNANTQVFGWLFGDIENKTIKNASGGVLYYNSVSEFPSASSNNGKYAFLIKRDDTDLVEFAEIYVSNGTAWEIFSSDSPHGKLSVIGGTYVMNCSGLSTYFVRLSFAHVEVDSISVTVTNTHTESYSGTAPDGILKLVKLICSTADIKNSTLNSYYTGNVDMHTNGIDADVCSVLSMDNVRMICDAPYHDNSGNSYGTYCCAIGRACFAYVRNCNLNSMHAAIDNKGNCFVDGGVYESISHGGIYVSGRGVIVVQNAHIGAGTYTGLGELQYGVCAFTLGWEPTDKPTCFLHNCTLEAPSAKGFIVFRTAVNANLYMSKTNIPANKMIRVDYVKAVGGQFADMTDAEKPIIHVGNDCNVTLDMLACRTRTGNSAAEPPIKTQFTTTDSGKILFDSVNSSSDEESVADADAIKNSLNVTKENYVFFFSPYEWKKIVGSLMTFRSYITDISAIQDELNGINALVGSGVIG